MAKVSTKHCCTYTNPAAAAQSLAGRRPSRRLVPTPACRRAPSQHAAHTQTHAGSPPHCCRNLHIPPTLLASLTSTTPTPPHSRGATTPPPRMRVREGRPPRESWGGGRGLPGEAAAGAHLSELHQTLLHHCSTVASCQFLFQNTA